MSSPLERSANQGAELGEREPMAFKKVMLVTPPYARRYGLSVDRPVFLSDTDGVDQKPFVYEVGVVLETTSLPDVAESFNSLHPVKGMKNVHVFGSRPKYGIGYEQMPRYVMTNGCEYWGNVRGLSWVAILEPLGKVLEHDEEFSRFNRVTDKARVKEILAFCTANSCKELPALQEGLAVGPMGAGNHLACCGSELHPDALKDKFHTFAFRIPFDGAQPVFERN